MKKKVITTPVEAKATDATNAVETANAAISIREWWACEDRGGLIVIQLADGRYGLLHVDLGRAFDGSDDWCKLDAIGNAGDGSKDGGHARYLATQFVLPKGIRKYILRRAVSMVMTDIADHLAEYRSDVPEFCAYVSAEGMKSGSAEAEVIEDFADGLTGCDLDYEKKDKKEVFANLGRLACECRQLWGDSLDMEQVPATHGFEFN